MEKTPNSYNLSRDWFDFCFENPEIVRPIHTALFFFCIEWCNRLGWKDKFGLPTAMTMEALGIKSYNTYKDAFEQLESFGFIKVIQKSKNQHSANIIALSKNNKATAKALDKAINKATAEQMSKHLRSNCSIDKPKNYKPKNNKTKESIYSDLDFISDDFKQIVIDWLDYKKSRGEQYKAPQAIKAFHTELQKLSGGDVEIAKQIVTKSMASNWKGIFPLKTEENGDSRGRKTAQTAIPASTAGYTDTI